MNQTVVVAYSNAAEARLLQIPRTKLCTGKGRCFPGSLSCGQFSSGRCKFRIGCIATDAGSQPFEGAVVDSGIGVDHFFTTWESTRNTDLWKRFERHLRRCHFLEDNESSSKLSGVHCPKCPVKFSNSKDLFEHCFGLLELGLFCRLCRYPFDLNRNSSSIYLHCRNHHVRKDDRPYNWTITNFADFWEGRNLEIATKDVLSRDLKIVVKSRRLPTVDDGCGLSGLQSLPQIETASPSFAHSAENLPSAAASSEAESSKNASKRGKFIEDLPDNQDSFYYDSSLRKLVCSRCNKLYPDKLTVKSHIMNSHVKRKCRNCSKTFSSWSWYLVHNRECLAKKKPAFDKCVAARNDSKNGVSNTKFNSESYSILVAEDVKPAKRAKLMSKMDVPELPESLKLSQSADDSLLPPNSDSVQLFGLRKESIDLKPSITVNGDVTRFRGDATAGNDSSELPIFVKLESTFAASEEPVPTSFSVKEGQKFRQSLDLWDLKDVKIEPLDPNDVPGVRGIDGIGGRGDGEEDPGQFSGGFRGGAEEPCADSVILSNPNNCDVKMEELLFRVEDCDDMKLPVE